MKKKLALVLTAVTLSMSLLIGCGASSNVPESTETATATAEPTATPEPTEAHEHTYTEAITTEATCETDGEATYTCECGDTYTEPITATGHIFATYASNNDATYLADGTETATCNTCDVTDTRTAEGSMLAYTYTDMDATMYAQQTVNVRSMPSTDGEKLGGLSTNDEVKITGQCVETSWYRIEYDGNVAYVSNSYLGADKVVVQAEAPASAPAQSASTSTEFPYELWTLYYTPDGKLSYYYWTQESIDAKGTKYSHVAYPNVHYPCNNYNNLQFGHMRVDMTFEEMMVYEANVTTCDDMEAYIATAEANGLKARSSVETPWRTPEGHKIYKHCG